MRRLTNFIVLPLVNELFSLCKMRNKELEKLFLFCLLVVAVINTVGRVGIKRDLLPGFLCLVRSQHEEIERL